ncbi:type II toxin-antitoxin system PemK/MazF family toxin [Solibacillus isronensis]|uniref:type II toxin-antitoxin system PemK/MazF family toxin n=1 Tax=Solibacillus isronensis TaxID=412383 RepID=UPI0009A5BC5E|nr:type II toxin-antitoxin system PemK/MazF family toxin [Solibacillus isronensis]
MTRPDPQKIQRMLKQDAEDRSKAQQGEFFMANVQSSAGLIMRHPVLIVGKHNDSNDNEDVIACLCTSQPKRSNYDLPAKLKEDSFVRTNKIYLLGRNQLIHKIRRHSVTPQEITNYIMSANTAIKIL